MTYEKNSHCSYCGALFGEVPFPRKCKACDNTTYINPVPVAVVLLPVETEQDTGLLTIRRTIEPKRGLLALPGGFLNLGESWQAGGVREVKEETGIELDAGGITLFDTLSAPDGTVLVFGLSKPVTRSSLPAFTENAEASEFVILTAPQDLAFPLHTAVSNRFFAERKKERR